MTTDNTSKMQIISELNTKSTDEMVNDFSELLKKINDVDDKKKQLWKEIYENAITDRKNAYVMFANLVNIVDGKSTEFAVHGKTLSTFLERMSKANDQLIKLVDLISRAEKAGENIDSDDMFNMIGGRSN